MVVVAVSLSASPSLVPPWPAPEAGGRRKTSRTTEPRGLVVFTGDSTSTRPAWERWTASRNPPSKPSTTYFPRRPTPVTARPTRTSGLGVAVLSPLKPSSS